MRSWSCLRMILNAKNRELTMTHPFHGPVIQIDVSHLNFGWQ